MAPVNLGTGVTPGPDAILIPGNYGGVVLAGQTVQEDPTDGKWKLASDANVTTPRRCGVAMNSGPTSGQPGTIQIGGTVLGTATLVVATPYFLCDAAGSVDVDSAQLTGDYTTYMGVAPTATSFKLQPHVSGVAKP